MRAYGKFMLALACTVAFATVVAPGTSEAAQECNGDFMNQVINESLVVNDGDVCDLDNVTVNGSLTVNGGTISVNNSIINGSWSISGDVRAPSFFCNNIINGDLNVHDVTSGVELLFGEAGAEPPCAGGTIHGSVTAVNSPGVSFEIDRYTVNGDLTVLGVGSGEVEGTTVRGTATCQPGLENNNEGGAGGAPNTFVGPNNGCPVEA